MIYFNIHKNILLFYLIQLIIAVPNLRLPKSPICRNDADTCPACQSVAYWGYITIRFISCYAFASKLFCIIFLYFVFAICRCACLYLCCRVAVRLFHSVGVVCRIVTIITCNLHGHIEHLSFLCKLEIVSTCFIANPDKFFIDLAQTAPFLE